VGGQLGRPPHPVLGGVDQSLATAELYQPTSMSWQSAGTMQAARTGAVAAALSNGQVLADGGADVTGGTGGAPTVTVESSADRYSPPVAPGQATAPPIGAPFEAVVSSGANPLILGLAGGAVLLAAALGASIELRRRRAAETTGTE